MFTVNSSIKSPKIPELVNSFLNSYTYIPTDRESISKLRNMLRKDPISRYCIEIISLYMFSALGDYQHSKASIRKDIQGSISNCAGSWRQILKKMSSCFWYGWSFSEVACTDTQFNRKILSEIYTLNPFHYSFAGKDKAIKEVEVLTDVDLNIPYGNGIHLVVGSDISFNEVFGCGRGEAALPYWELQQLMLGVIAIAGQRQATPILVQKCDTDTDITLIGDDGQVKLGINGLPIVVKKGWIVLQKLVELGSAGVTVVDSDDELYSVEMKTDGQFLLDIVKYTEYQRMLSFMVPVTLGNTSLSGVGDSNLSKIHEKIFQMMILSMLEFLMEEIVEKLFRPIIIYNFGEQSDYGRFEIHQSNDNQIKLMELAIEMIKTGAPGLNTLSVINYIRRNLGLDDFENVE
ncbi:MAG: phage portal protein family protein [Waterburya sp.]